MELVIMAGGLGSRFGGLKQLQPVDEEKNFILDYSIFDAIKSGFDKVVFIIKEENLDIFRETVGKRVEKRIKTVYAFQNNKNVPEKYVIPENRVKPLGTAHAILCAEEAIDDNFVVINADDFYGREAFEDVSKFLKRELKKNEFSLVAYRLGETLSDKGTVKRGVCSVENNLLMGMVESEVKHDENGEVISRPLDNKQEAWQVVDKATPVNMNLFAFSKDIFSHLKKGFIDFLEKNKEDLSSVEYLLPILLSDLVKNSKAKVEVIPTKSVWRGITYAEDLKEFKEFIKEQKANGKYPERLWEN